MKDGAVDFVGKPFGEKHQLERKIHEALQKYPPRKKPDTRPGNVEPPRPFTGGTLDFYADRVDLCGEKIAGAKGETQMRQIMDLLKRRRLTNDKRSYDSRFIARELNFRRGQSAVIDAVRQIRDACTNIMLDKLNIECGKSDVVCNREKGYTFADEIEVREGGTESVNSTHADLTENQLAILRELLKQPAISRKVISNRLHIKFATLDAEIADLVTKGIIVQTGNGAAMRYKLLEEPKSDAQ